MSRRPPALLLALTLVAALLTGIGAFASANDPCGPGVEAIRVDDGWLCTHGNDDPPPGVDTTELPSTDELMAARYGADSLSEAATATDSSESELTTAGSVACVDDGKSGPRIQLIYARAANVSSRYSSVLPLLRQYASDADDVVNTSAGRVGDGRRIRYVTNNNCLPVVMNLTLSNTGDDSFGNMVSELKAMGLTSKDRKYMVYMDAAVGICGLGQLYLNDRGDQANPNNAGYAMYARVDTSCWQHAVAHEILHTLGAVQNSAPNTTKAGHCTDTMDIMCYKDTKDTVLKQVCNRSGQVDCNNDDYFHPNPKANSYLANKWNVARSRYLVNTAAPPLPAETSVTVPSSGYAGVGWPVRANLSTTDATVVWSSTRSECWFDDPYAPRTTWTCPAGTTGEVQITAIVNEKDMATHYANDAVFAIPSQPLHTTISSNVSSKAITSGQSLTIKGVPAQASTLSPLSGVTVRAWSRPHSGKSWTRIGEALTNRNGVVRFDVAPTRNTYYRLTTVQTPVWGQSASGAQRVTVKTRLHTKMNSQSVTGLYTTTSTRTKISGSVSPNKAGKTIKLKHYRKGKWRTVKKKEINSKSRYVFRYRTPTDGKYRLRVVKPADKRNTRSIRRLTITAR